MTAPRTRQLLHYGAVALATLLLALFGGLLHRRWTIEAVPLIRDYWAAILFIACYVFVRSLLTLIKAFSGQDDGSLADFEMVWNEGVDALAAAGLDLRSLPVFLLVGLREEDEQNFLASARFSPSCVSPPEDVASPLRFFANREAVFVSCSGASAISAQAEVAASRPPAAVISARVNDEHTWTGDEIQRHSDAEATWEPDQFEDVNTEHLSNPALPPPTPALVDEEELLRRSGRLQHLCRLVSRTRAPFCPINGALVLIPIAWGETGGPAEARFAERVEQDLRILHAGLRLQFPVVCLFTGLQYQGDIRELIKRVREAEPAFVPNVRAGAHFPQGLPLNRENGAWVIDKGLDWFRMWIYASYTDQPSHSTNPQIYRFYCRLHGLRSGLIALVERGFGPLITREPVRLCGCYFCSISEKPKEQAFVKGVIRKLIDEQDNVAYPKARIARDRMYGVLGLACCLLIAVLACTDVALLWAKCVGRPASAASGVSHAAPR